MFGQSYSTEQIHLKKVTVTLISQFPLHQQARNYEVLKDCKIVHNTGFQWKNYTSKHPNGAEALWLEYSTPDRVVRVQAMAGAFALCFWARHLTLTWPLSTQVYKWVPASLILGGNLVKA